MNYSCVNRMFVCPDDPDASAMPVVKHDIGGAKRYFWDFYDVDGGEHWKKLSYSVQTPFSPWGSKRPLDVGYGLLSRDDLVILADKAPKQIGFKQSDAGNRDRQKLFISQNHQFLARFNYVRYDIAVLDSDRPDVGVDHDDIYSTSDRSDGGRQFGGKTWVGNHKSPDDSYLLGPNK